MGATGFSLFPTSIGFCAIAWHAQGITGVWLPEASRDTLRRKLSRHLQPCEPPPAIQHAIVMITALLQGEPVDLRDITLDTASLPDFHRRVYDLTRTIPPGQTRTYGELAAALGEPAAARAVGQALGRNPFSIVVPCHRVLAAGGRAGGFTAPGGTATKLRLLEIEGALDMPLIPRSVA